MSAKKDRKQSAATKKPGGVRRALRTYFRVLGFGVYMRSLQASLRVAPGQGLGAVATSQWQTLRQLARFRWVRVEDLSHGELLLALRQSKLGVIFFSLLTLCGLATFLRGLFVEGGLQIVSMMLGGFFVICIGYTYLYHEIRSLRLVQMELDKRRR